MAKKSIILTIVAHEPYPVVPGNADDECFMQAHAKLYYAMTHTYIPLLDMCAALEKDAVPFSFALVLSPTLCALFADKIISDGYVRWLDRLIALGESEIKKNTDIRKEIADRYLSLLHKTRTRFTETYGQNILGVFRRFSESGHIELVGTSATFAFLPHYIDLPEIIDAQIEVGLQSHRYFFGVIPSGFWLPYMGYANGIEKHLYQYGIRYTALDSQGVLFADPVPENGIFEPVRCRNGLMVFACDRTEPSGQRGAAAYARNRVYRSTERDIAFEDSVSELSGYVAEGEPRSASGFAYWSHAEGMQSLYNCESAEKQLYADACDFLDRQYNKLSLAGEYAKADSVLISSVLPSDILGVSWSEGPMWLEQVFRVNAERHADMEFTTYSGYSGNRVGLQSVEPYLSASSGAGYGEDMLDTSNSWIVRYIRKASERMVDLADRFADGSSLKARILNLAARDILLAQCGSWPEFLNGRYMSDFASDQIRDRITAFTAVYESLGAGMVSTEWLAACEKTHRIFPWINYRIFSRKK